MYIHGAIAALVGTPNQPKLACNFVKKLNGHDQPVEIVDSFTENIHTDQPAEIQRVMERFLTVLCNSIKLQASDLDYPNQVIPVIVGCDARCSYGQLPQQMLNNLGIVAKKLFNKETINNLFNKISLRLGAYQETILDSRSGQTVDWTGDADETFTRITQNPYLQQVNRTLGQLKDKVEKKCPNAITQASDIAFSLGEGFAHNHLSDPDQRFVFNMSRLKRSRESADPEALHILDFVSWHPNIKTAFREGHASVRGPIQVVVKGINEPSSPPFVDIIACYIQDAFQKIENLQPPEAKTFLESVITAIKRIFDTR